MTPSRLTAAPCERSTRARLGQLAAVVAGCLLLSVAAVVLVVVIPPVSEDTHTTALPEAAVRAFYVHIAVGVGASAILLLAGTRVLNRRRWFVVAAVLSLVLAFTLLDAGNEFARHGPDLRRATQALRLGTAAELLAALLAAIAALSLRGAPDDEAGASGTGPASPAFRRW
jgi:hypothetical protein